MAVREGNSGHGEERTCAAGCIVVLGSLQSQSIVVWGRKSEYCRSAWGWKGDKAGVEWRLEREIKPHEKRQRSSSKAGWKGWVLLSADVSCKFCAVQQLLTLLHFLLKKHFDVIDPFQVRGNLWCSPEVVPGSPCIKPKAQTVWRQIYRECWRDRYLPSRHQACLASQVHSPPEHCEAVSFMLYPLPQLL